MSFELFDDRAPRSCDAFIRSVAAGGWDDAAFFRAVRADNDNGSPIINVVQGMAHSPTTTSIEHESTRDTNIHHTTGTMSLARAELGSATGDHLFICLEDTPALDHRGQRQADGEGFAAFGQVVAGLDIIRRVHSGECVAGDDDYTRGQILRRPLVVIRTVLGA